MKNWKRAMSCVVAVTMVFALAACSQQTQGTQTPPTQAQAGSDLASTAGTSPAKTNPTPAAEPTQTGAAQAETESAQGSTLVVYFSATGNTGTVAGYISDLLGADVYEIVPEEIYTSDDLNWRNKSSRSSTEHADSDFRPAIAGELPDLSGYDTIFVGYPIWWGEAPNIVWNFVESADLTGKTIIPFCTSSSSDFGSSGETLAGFAPDANWLDGQRFRSGVSEEDVVVWVNGLELDN